MVPAQLEWMELGVGGGSRETTMTATQQPVARGVLKVFYSSDKKLLSAA
jgi:hypothetical protein